MRSPRYAGLETWETGEVLSALLGGQHQALHAVWGALGQIEAAVGLAAERLSGTEGRLIYTGAGTSGRLGTLDGIELTPTFGWPTSRIVYLFAGGEVGQRHSRERAEDDVKAGQAGIVDIDTGASDVVIGLAASGTTPFTRAAIQTARSRGALTISFANNPDAPLLADAEIGVLLRSGPEVLAGSTRLGAGTSQKAALGLFSTTLMVRLNKVYRGHMVDMQTSNEKLVLRAQRMLVELTGCTNPEAQKALKASDGNVKLAVLVHAGTDRKTALEILARHHGNLEAALAKITRSAGEKEATR
ncbi:MAG: N-acetylmuramic acid 6-phosphate etherase [Alphaproteobacteria bacterium]|nr:N-acetylmuramic acid 6-phosphate etherase [Alphaproteobacteria bacterium]